MFGRLAMNAIIFDLDGLLIDSEAGIQAAFSAHIPVICVPDMKRLDSNYEKMAQAVLPSLLEVIEYLKRLEGTV